MSKINRLNHIGIAVPDLDVGENLFSILFGKPPINRETVSTEKVNTSFFAMGESQIELLEATDENSTIAKFLKKMPKGGIHHLCFEVDDIIKKCHELKDQGFVLIYDKPKEGAHQCLVNFIHPKSAGGVLIELSQKIKRG